MSFQSRAADAIRASGGRMTSQRALVLDLLANSHDDLDAERLHQLASEYDPNISLPTIYRTLNTLEAARLISPRYSSSDHERKIYHVAGDRDVFRFTCRHCGCVITFQSQLIQQLKQELITQLGADVTTFCMCAGGLCVDCREEAQ